MKNDRLALGNQTWENAKELLKCRFEDQLVTRDYENHPAKFKGIIMPLYLNFK